MAGIYAYSANTRGVPPGDYTALRNEYLLDTSSEFKDPATSKVYEFTNSTALEPT
jgi:hypothetical protein